VRAWWGVLRRAVKGFGEDNLTDWAAALTYYGVLSIFPSLIVLVSILGLAGDSATQSVLNNLNDLGSGPATDIISRGIRQVASSQGTAGVALIVGLVAALWSASGYVGAFSRASNVIYGVGEDRPFWKRRPLQIAMTLLLLVLVSVSAIAVVLSGPLAEQAGKLFGVGDTAVTVWGIVKWPVIVLVVVGMLEVLYYGAPDVRHAGFRWITPGGALAVILWILASAGFALYVAEFGSYNKTYGSLAGVIVFLIWLWLSNVAVLLGAELNAELERRRALETSAALEEQTTTLQPRNEPDGTGDFPPGSSGPSAEGPAPMATSGPTPATFTSRERE
jgi:membrane protein